MDAKTYPHRSARQGFTLVELLVVVIIITMLAGLGLKVGVGAMHAARRAVIVMEIRQLTIAMEQYKNECGEYPPDCFCVNYTGSDPILLTIRTQSRNAILRHFRNRFSRYQPGAYTKGVLGQTIASGTDMWGRLRLDVYNSSSDLTENDPSKIDPQQGFDINRLNPSSALMFFLGGIPDYEPDTSDSRLPSDPAAKGGELLGFNTNPTCPFSRGGSRTAPVYEFDETRVKWDEDNQVYSFFPQYIKNPANSSEGVPYVYFRPQARAYGLRTLGDVRYKIVQALRYPLTPSADYGICFPYADTEINTTILGDTTNYPDTDTIDWHEGKRYQIIAAGLDGMYGTTNADGNYDPSADPLDAYRYLNANANNMKPEEDDNLSSFTADQLCDGLQ